MSHPLVSRSADLSRLEMDGYDIEIRANHLVVHHVPYVAAGPVVLFGDLISELTHNGTSTVAPSTHEIWFTGNYPCDNYGGELTEVINQRKNHNFGEGLVANCSFSQKPPSGSYPDYFAKVTPYVRIIGGYAKVLDPSVTARTYPAHPTAPDESVFRYADAASSRAGISAITAKLQLDKVAIIGLGGTGAFILDLVAKTPVKELHLYDDAVFSAHNAFRAPGAASLDELRSPPSSPSRPS